MIWIIQNIWTNEIKAFKSLTDAAFYMSANHNSIRNKFSKNACNKVIVKDWAVYHKELE
jgi:hypothetical protein|tara:strand:- start:28463 stop:28639 length:177 start_codon:yes stop_codon:yes gene_type:complete